MKELFTKFKIHLWIVGICYVIGFGRLMPESHIKEPSHRIVEKVVKVSDGYDGDYHEEVHEVPEYYNKAAGRAYEKAKTNEFDLWTVGYGWLGFLMLLSILRKAIIGKLILIWPSLIEGDQMILILPIPLYLVLSSYPLIWLGSSNMYIGVTVYITVSVFIFLEFRRRLNSRWEHKKDI